MSFEFDYIRYSLLFWINDNIFTTAKADMAPLHEFKRLIDQNDFNAHFPDVIKTHADRAIGQQLKMVHRTSGIRCTVCFDTEPPSTLVSDILLS